MINRRFINFKTYNAFLAKKNEIPNDAIVFIQDKPCIWAHGKEYVCDGPYTANTEGQSLKFKNGNDQLIFSISQDDGTITIIDADGNRNSATYVLKDTFDDTINSLAAVAFSGSYKDLVDKPTIPVVDTELDSRSPNPVQNSAVKTELDKKADLSVLNSYISNISNLQQQLNQKQNKLRARDGIQLDLNGDIWCTLDTNVYEFVTTMPDKSVANPNKIYILEIQNGDGTYRYEQKRLRNNEWVSFDLVMPEVNLTSYYTRDEANAEHTLIWNAINSIDLTTYATKDDLSIVNAKFNNYALTSYVDSELQLVDNQLRDIKNNYATKQYVDDTFVRKADVYKPKQGEWGTDENSGEGGQTIIIQPTQAEIEIDKTLDVTSHRPVENRAIKLELDKKANISELSNFVQINALANKVDRDEIQNFISQDDVTSLLNNKQDKLHPGRGIDFVDGAVICTLDTEVYVFVIGTLPSPQNASPNKIYILERTENGETTYTQWRWDTDLEDWVNVGTVAPEINLTPYLKVADAAAMYETQTHASQTYQEKGNYALNSSVTELRSYVDNTFQEKITDYVDESELEALRINLYGIFQKSGNYVSPDAVSQALNQLQVVIDEKYVLKKDVYNINNNAAWSTSDPVTFNLPASNGGGSSSGSTEPGGQQQSNPNTSGLVTLTVQQYEALVRNNLVDPNTYYFTYEETTWGFGDQFPIVLTDGSTPDSIGTFPINLA